MVLAVTIEETQQFCTCNTNRYTWDRTTSTCIEFSINNFGGKSRYMQILLHITNLINLETHVGETAKFSGYSVDTTHKLMHDYQALFRQLYM